MKNSLVNMFKDDITVFRFDEQSETYTKYIVNGVYWFGNNLYNNSNKGKDKYSGISIVIPFNNLDGYIPQLEDIALKGLVNININSIKELSNYEKIVINSITKNDVDSLLSIQNIVLNGV